ncbi:MAG: hypothetical protein ACOYXC_11450 [Candidatus Rifleibacteriota bacterium]
MAQGDKSQTGQGCLRKTFIGFGCGCVYPLFMLIAAGIFAWFFLAEPFSAILQVPELPDFAGPEQEDFWTLQDKRLKQVETQNDIIDLSPSEFNALLARIDLAPAKGFCLQRIRFVPELGKGRLYLIGSGFFMRSMIFTLGINATTGKPKIESITVNSWKASGFGRDKVEKYLNEIFTPARVPEIEQVISEQFRIDIQPDKISLPAVILQKKN